MLRERSDPAAWLFDAVQRYTDGLQLAAEQLVGPQTVQILDDLADQVVPGLTNEPSWPTLRAHLLWLAAETGEHPLLHLHTGAAGRELRTAADMAAVPDWRLPETPIGEDGLLPWRPGIPQRLQTQPFGGEYLARRLRLVINLAGHVRNQAGQDGSQPAELLKFTDLPPSGSPPDDQHGHRRTLAPLKARRSTQASAHTPS